MLMVGELERCAKYSMTKSRKARAACERIAVLAPGETKAPLAGRHSDMHGNRLCLAGDAPARRRQKRDATTCANERANRGWLVNFADGLHLLAVSMVLISAALVAASLAPRRKQS